MIGVLLIIAVIVIWILIQSNAQKSGEVKEAIHAKKSQSVIHGNSIEQFIPFMKNYPYERKNFRYLGKPIDGVQFNEDKIIFVEVKTGNSQLTPKEKNIKRLIEEGKVEWELIRV